MTATKRGTAVTRAGKQQFFFIGVELQFVSGHPVSDVQVTAIKLVDG